MLFKLNKRIKATEARIEKLKSLNAPSVLIENETNWLNNLKEQLKAEMEKEK